MQRKRSIIIGLDGVPFPLLKDLFDRSVMPHFKALAERSIFRQMESSIPEISSVAWSSAITGVNPGTHGIFGFTDLAEGSYITTFPNFTALKTAPFWEQDTARRSVILNVPSTYPAREMNGVLISGFVALDLKRATYPASLIPKLNEIGYRVDVDFERASESLGYFLQDLDNALKARIAAYRYFWENIDWDVFMLVFTGTDRLMHFLWNAYEDPEHEYHEAFLDHFRQIDAVIGEITDKMNDRDNLIMLSDHGFERLDKDIFVNHVLKQHNMLSFETEIPKNLKDISSHSKAFALDPGRIYINDSARFPRGLVMPQDREAVIGDLINIFNEFTIDGKKVIKRCFRREEIYHGQYSDRGPDIVLLANSGLNLRGTLNSDSAYSNGTLTGKHTQHDAFLLVHGGSDRIVPQKPCVSDMVNILNNSSEE